MVVQNRSKYTERTKKLQPTVTSFIYWTENEDKELLFDVFKRENIDLKEEGNHFHDKYFTTDCRDTPE